jgi:hydrogenase maturation factor
MLRAGIVPQAICPVALFPISSKVEQIKSVLLELALAATKNGLTVAKDHTEITPGLHKIIVIITIFGTGKRIVRHG